MGKRLQTVAGVAFTKALLMLFNFFFWCSGVLMLCAGIWMRIELRDYVDMSVEGSGAALLAVAGLGALVALASTLACCCTARGHPALLYLYGAFLAVVALLQLGAGASVYAYRNALTEGFDQSLNESLAVYNIDDDKTGHIDTMQSRLHCCGNRAYTDWLDMKPPKEIPTSCCIVSKKCDVNNPADIYTEGCYDRVINFINDNVSVVASSAVLVAFFPLVGLIFSCCLAKNINKAKYEQVA